MVNTLEIFCTVYSLGLFHKAIIQSGTYYNPWAQTQYKGISARRARQAAQLVGCDDKANWPELLNCMRSANAEKVVATVYQLFVSLSNRL